MKKPYVLVAPNGARRGKSDHPRLPVTTNEIVRSARACFDAGANGLHLHVRNKDGQHTLDAGLYLEVLQELHRAVPDMEIQITTEAAGQFDVTAQLDCLTQVRPKWASISVREIARDMELAPRVYALCEDQGTRVQHILYDEDDVNLLEQWQAAGIVRGEQTDRLLVLGRYAATQESHPNDLDSFPQNDSAWMVCAFGRREHDCLQKAALLGGDVRVGFENSMLGNDGVPWADNAASVAALVSRLEGTEK